jgi:hypothetical protein
MLGSFYESNGDLKAIIKKGVPHTTCGACNDCRESFAGKTLSPVPGRKVQIHCFEPSAANYHVLTKMHAHFFGNGNVSAMGDMMLHNVAVSNYTGVADMPSDCGELCQVKPHEWCSKAIRS